MSSNLYHNVLIANLLKECESYIVAGMLLKSLCSNEAQ